MVSYEEPATTIREQLAAMLEREEDWAKAAQVLAGIDLDSGARRRPVQAPLGGYIKDGNWPQWRVCTLKQTNCPPRLSTRTVWVGSSHKIQQKSFLVGCKCGLF